MDRETQVVQVQSQFENSNNKVEMKVTGAVFMAILKALRVVLLPIGGQTSSLLIQVDPSGEFSSANFQSLDNPSEMYHCKVVAMKDHLALLMTVGQELKMFDIPLQHFASNVNDTMDSMATTLQPWILRILGPQPSKEGSSNAVEEENARRQQNNSTDSTAVNWGQIPVTQQAPQQAVPFRYGESDLRPNGLRPDATVIDRQGGVTGGMFFGPQMFQPGGPGMNFGRFDPLVPGGGRPPFGGHPQTTFPGEPNPDHLRPFNNDLMPGGGGPSRSGFNYGW